MFPERCIWSPLWDPMFVPLLVLPFNHSSCILSFSHSYCAFNVMDEVAHKFHLVGFVRSFGIYAKSFFESGQKFSNLKQIKPEIIGQMRMRVHRGDIDFKALRDESVDFACKEHFRRRTLNQSHGYHNTPQLHATPFSHSYSPRSLV